MNAGEQGAFEALRARAEAAEARCVVEHQRASAGISAMLNAEDELHALADEYLSVWEGSNGKESVRVILDESSDFRAAQALAEIDALADKALAIYRRRVPAPQVKS